MRKEENQKKHLTPRQIVNRFRKGDYVDESIEAISSVTSACGETFNSVFLPFPTTIVEQVMENLGTIQALYDRQKAGLSTVDVAIPDYPQLKEILTDLSHPALWESLQADCATSRCDTVLYERGMEGKYRLEPCGGNIIATVDVLSGLYEDAIQRAGLSLRYFKNALEQIIK